METKKDAKENLSEIIAQIDVNLTINHREQYLSDYHHCPLCGDELVFTHVSHFINLEVKEEAFCQKCDIRTRAQNHKLH